MGTTTKVAQIKELREIMLMDLAYTVRYLAAREWDRLALNLERMHERAKKIDALDK